jgi:hypothetical protein
MNQVHSLNQIAGMRLLRTLVLEEKSRSLTPLKSAGFGMTARERLTTIKQPSDRYLLSNFRADFPV